MCTEVYGRLLSVLLYMYVYDLSCYATAVLHVLDWYMHYMTCTVRGGLVADGAEINEHAACKERLQASVVPAQAQLITPCRFCNARERID